MSITTSVEVSLTPEQLAEAFWNFDGDEQCAFFKALCQTAQETAPHALATQMCYVAEQLNKDPDRDGVSAMRTIADFTYKFGRLDERAEKWML